MSYTQQQLDTLRRLEIENLPLLIQTESNSSFSSLASLDLNDRISFDVPVRKCPVRILPFPTSSSFGLFRMWRRLTSMFRSLVNAARAALLVVKPFGYPQASGAVSAAM